MNRDHGDRTAQPRPLSELIAEHALEIEGPINAEEDYSETDFVNPEDTPDQQPTFAVQWRQWAVAVATTSFGNTGPRTNEELVDRCVYILNYVTNGKP